MKRPAGYDAPPAAAREEPHARGRAAAQPPVRGSRPAASSSSTASAPPTTQATSPRTTARRPRPTEPASPRAAARLVRRATRARKKAERAEVRRFTRSLRRRRIGWLVAGGVLVTLAGIVALGAFSPLFALRDIEVQGASRVAPTAIVEALSGELGRPLPLVDEGAVRTALSDFPLVETYTTELRPPGTLVVRIVERTPVAVIPDGAAFDLVDSAGVVLQTDPTRQQGFPVIDLQGAGRTDVPFTAAAAVLVALPDDLRAQVDSITARTTDDVSLVLTSGQRVVWGSAADSVRKAQHLAALLRQAPTTVTEYDVSSPGVGILR